MDDPEVHVRNGVDLGRLTGTVDAVRSNPSLARFTFRAKNRWIDGARSRTEIRGFFGAGEEHARRGPFLFEGDEPPVLMGRDAVNVNVRVKSAASDEDLRKLWDISRKISPVPDRIRIPGSGFPCSEKSLLIG